MPLRRRLSFGKKLALGFSIPSGLALLITLISLAELRRVILTKDQIASQYAEDLVQAEKLRSLVEGSVAADRGLALMGDQFSIENAKKVHEDFSRELSILQVRMAAENDDPTDDRLIADVGAAEKKFQAAWDRLLGEQALRTSGLRELRRKYTFELRPLREALDRAMNRFVAYKRSQLDEARKHSARSASIALAAVMVIGTLVLAISGIFGLLLARNLNTIYISAQGAIRTREDVVAIVSHDLKNPVSAVSLNAKLGLRLLTDESPAKLKKLLESIIRSSERMERLIRGLLDLSKMEADMLALEMRVEPANELISESLDLVRPILDEKKIRVSVDSVNPELHVICDRERILQVLSNLLSNAVKFSLAGGAIELGARKLDHKILFSVRDHGAGIPPEKLSGIFDRYTQARFEDRTRGTGLGLYIVKGIMDAHEGRIYAESRVNQGSTFSFELNSAED